MSFDLRLACAVARKELADAGRNRWLWVYAAGFAVVASALAFLAIPGAGQAGFGGFGRTAASLVALVQILVPLMALTLGAQTVAGQAERGTLRFVLTHPVERFEVLAGTAGGLVLALWGSVAAGFGAAALAAALGGTSGDPGSLLVLAGLSALLATAMLAVGLAVGTSSRRASTAVGGAVLAWILLVFGGDLGIMGTAVATRLPVGVLFFAVAANPVEAFRLAAVPAFGSSLDVLGPAGTYAVDTLGAAATPLAVGVLLVWTVVPVAVAARSFARRDL